MRAMADDPAPDRAAAAPQRVASVAPEAAAEGASAEGGGGSGGAAKAGGGDPGARDAYAAGVHRWLLKHQRYPRLSVRRREEGVGRLRFSVGADGGLLASELTRSTGHEALDREILAMAERASPLPPIPDSIGRARLEIVLDIAFRLR